MKKYPVCTKEGKFHPLYNSWYAMKGRCNNHNNKQFKDYGGRGITYPIEWENFQNFANDMGDSWEKGLTLDRINNNDSYSFENCRWATRREQNINKRCNHILSFKGMKMTMPEWAEYLNMDFGTLRSRFYRGMTLDEILNGRLFRPQKLNK